MYKITQLKYAQSGIHPSSNLRSAAQMPVSRSVSSSQEHSDPLAGRGSVELKLRDAR
jgi:hypothetical protein